MAGQTEIISGRGARLRARVAGLLYLGCIAGGVGAMFLRMGLIAPGDAAVTASHIQGSEGLYRLAFTAELLGTACYVGVTALLYELLAPAGRTLSRVAAYFSLTGCALGGVSIAFMLAALLLLGRPAYLTTAFTPAQLEALAMVSLRLHSFATTVGISFFGVYCAAIGVLVFRSTYLPRVVGAFLVVAGVGWLADTYIYFLIPELSKTLGDLMLLPGFVGEGSLAVWLVAAGLDAPRWDERRMLVAAA